jgi:hypothetical protein
VIAHIILFRPKAELTPVERRAVVDALTTAASHIPGIQRFRVGRRVRHHLPGYEQAMREDFEYAVLIEFSDIETLKQYLQHPSHAAIGRHFTESAAASLAYDYQIVDGEEVASLIGEAPG